MGCSVEGATLGGSLSMLAARTMHASCTIMDRWGVAQAQIIDDRAVHRIVDTGHQQETPGEPAAVYPKLYVALVGTTTSGQRYCRRTVRTLVEKSFQHYVSMAAKGPL